MNNTGLLQPIVILGPTAGGKSELAVALAEALRAGAGPFPGVINADSMQVYRHLDAGTAKPSPALRRRAPHHLIDIVEPTERFTVHDWLTRAEALLAQMQTTGVRSIIVGGTNLYLKTWLEGMFASAPGSGHDPQLRGELEALTNEDLHARLAQADPAAAQRIHRNDRKRMVRAIEVFTLTGQRISTLQTQWDSAEFRVPNSAPAGVEPGISYRHNPILIGLDWPPPLLNHRINQRVKEMFFPAACGLASESLPDEVRRLEAAGLLGSQARLALGYQQVLAHLRGEMPLDEAFEKTKIATRRYAKQQRAWLKRYRGVHWLPAADCGPADLLQRALQFIPSRGL